MIRIAREEDSAQLAAIYGWYVENTAVSFEYEAPKVAEFAGRIREILQTHPFLVYEEDSRLLGYAYAHPLIRRKACDWAVEVSIYIRRDARGKGIGRMLYEALENILLRQNICTLEACVAACDREDKYLTDSSVRFHTRMGYQTVGKMSDCGYKFGRWYHLLWMEKHIAQRKADTEAMRPFPEIRDLWDL
ncbi:MAG: GNAT family N-acetyltransferase [Ruminococcaceae bacterium]|nr:GNAT family N-acetyltransferase [Oscillospiraceae bacterium]